MSFSDLANEEINMEMKPNKGCSLLHSQNSFLALKLDI